MPTTIQYPTIPWRWPFWVQLAYEHALYGLGIATMCYFALVFPMRHPLLDRYPRLVPAILYLSFPIAVMAAMAPSPTWSVALKNGSHASWIVALVQLAVAIGAGIRSVRTARDPVTRAQIRWILWWVAVGCAVLIPGYVLPLMISGRALIPHPITMIFIVLIPVVLAIAILRYRLFDIEIIINRTLVYGTLIVTLGALYLFVVRLLTWAIQAVSPHGNDTLSIFVATLTIALAFAPLQQRVQGLIDRTFYRSKLDFQRLLPEMSESLVTSVNLEELAELLTHQLPRQLQLSWATLAVVDPRREQYVRVGHNNNHNSLSVDHPLAHYLQGTGQPLMRLLPPPDLPIEALDFAEQQGIELSIPLIVGSELVGLYNLGPKLSRDAYGRDEIRLLHLLGRQAAVAAENGRLFQAERTQRQLAEALQQAADVVSSTLDLDQVLDRILEQVERVMAGDAFNIMLIENAHAQVVRWRGYEQFEPPDAIAGLNIPLTQYSTLHQMIQTGEPIVVLDTATDPDWTPLAGWSWLRSYLSAPIRVAGRTVGFLNVDGTRPGQFGPADATRLQAFAHHAAAALENARLYAATQKQLKEQTALREAGTVISSALDTETVLTRIAEAMGRAIDATSAYISSYEPATMLARVRAEYIGPQACAEERVSDLGVAYPEEDDLAWLELMQAGHHSVTHIDDPEITAADLAHMQRYGAKSILYVPLRVKDQFIGYAELWESQRRREFGPDEIALCNAIAQQAANALEHARLYEQAQLEIAERILAEEQLKASLSEKEVLLKEIHHRVKNNLQVISSLLNVQSKYVHDQETLRMLQDSRHRVRSMALVHERLYQAEDLARIDFAKYIRSLASYLIRSYGAGNLIKLAVDLGNVSLSVDTAIPCGLILNELISNSFKHAFPDQRPGQINVSFRERDGNLVLTVRDNGIGMPAGLDFRNTESLGLQLVNTLVHQLEGSIELESSDGTAFKITFSGLDQQGKGDSFQ